VTREEALNRYDRIRYNLLNSDDKAAVDMAFEALRGQDALMAEIKGMCHLCRHYNYGIGYKPCDNCDGGHNFEWRGAKEDT
jgi:hypothetical protein